MAPGSKSPVRVIVTVPPYAPFLGEVARHPLVAGLRLNTVMPLAESKRAVLERLSALGPPLWVDLKGRQLRVAEACVPPFTEVRVNHRLRVKTPADVFFGDGREHARIAAVDGNRLILEDGPRRVIGPGESLNIVDDSLEIEGTLTQSDVSYLEAMSGLGLKRVMLSFTESTDDPAEIEARLPGVEAMLKIESRRGLEYSREHRSAHGRLCAARGDLFVEVEPHEIVRALRLVIEADPEAVVGSRLFLSLAHQPTPESADIGDFAFLHGLGYRTFVLGDEVCLRRDTVMSALNLLEATAAELE